MKAKELLETNQLSAAVAELNQEVKSRPTDPRLRTFLFELLCFEGEFQRAQIQLDVIGHQSENASVGVEVYRNLIRAEIARRRLFSDGLRPTFLFEPPPYVALHLDAVNCLRGGNAPEAKALLKKSEQQRSSLNGQAAGQKFSTFRDSDDRLAPILELFIKNTYVWLPFEQLRKLTIAEPKQLRDLLWVPATIEMGDGQGGEVFVPVLYAGSEQDSNEQVRLGRITEWLDLGDGLAGGVGQRTFVIDEGERSLLELREVEFGVGSVKD